MATMKVKLNRLRTSPSKVRLVADAVRGMKVRDAQIQLSIMEKKSAEPMLKLLNSGIAGAQHNFGFDPENLFIQELLVGEGMTLKRWLPRAHGRATKLLKRTSHITMTLAEIEEGKNRTEPAQKKSMEAAAKKTTEVSEDAEEAAVKPELSAKAQANVKPTKAAGAQKQQMFRRKSS